MAESFVWGLLAYEDLNQGYGTFGPVTLPDGTSGLLHKVPPVPFIDVKAPPYNAAGDGTTDDTVTINSALTAASNAGGGVVYIPPSNYKITNRITVPANVLLMGAGRVSKFVSSIPAGLTEMVRLGGDYAAISNMWLTGTGQGDGSSVNGSRGIWIGNTPDYIAEGRVNYARVENVVCDQFIGNAVAGDYWYATIVNNWFLNNTNTHIFLQPTCNRNLVQGNTLIGSRYHGVDCNGSDNRFVANYAEGNGTALGLLSNEVGCGFLVAVATAADGLPVASRNTFIGNWAIANKAAGFFLAGQGATPGTAGPYGNVFKGNVAVGHTNVLLYNSSVIPGWSGGFVNSGPDSTVFEGNLADGNVFNFVVTGNTVRNATGCQVIGNNSLNAQTNANLTGIGQPSGVGYLFPGSARMLDGTSGHPVDGLILRDNWDRYAASDSYRIDLALATTANVWNGMTIVGNNSDQSGGWGFNCVNPNQLLSYVFDGNTNLVTNATSGKATGLNRFALTANSTTPSVAYGRLWNTANSNPTTYTNFTGGIQGQVIEILINDANSTFNFHSGSLKGNFSTDYFAVSGDLLRATYVSATGFWYCEIFHAGPATVFANVNQAGTKSTGVTQNGVLSGRITMVVDGAGIGGGAVVSFTLTNNAFTTSRDAMFFNHVGGGTLGAYTIGGADAGAGSITVYVRNNTGGNLDQALIIDYEIRKR